MKEWFKEIFKLHLLPLNIVIETLHIAFDLNL
jgi:hypothetical protein